MKGQLHLTAGERLRQLRDALADGPKTTAELAALMQCTNALVRKYAKALERDGHVAIRSVQRPIVLHMTQSEYSLTSRAA